MDFACGSKIIATFGCTLRNLDSENLLIPRSRDASIGVTWQNDAFRAQEAQGSIVVMAKPVLLTVDDDREVARDRARSATQVW